MSKSRQEILAEYGIDEAEFDDEDGPPKLDVDLWEVLGAKPGTGADELKKIYRKVRSPRAQPPPAAPPADDRRPLAVPVADHNSCLHVALSVALSPRLF